MKPVRCTDFSNLFLEWNSTCYGQFLCPSSVFHCTHSNGVCHTGLLTACEKDQDGTLSCSCSQAVKKPLWHIPLLCVQWKTPDDGQRNCPKHVEFHSKNKCDKLVDLVGFTIRINYLIHKTRHLSICWARLIQPTSSLSYFFKINFKITLQFTPRSIKWALCSKFPKQNSVCGSVLSHTWHLPPFFLIFIHFIT